MFITFTVGITFSGDTCVALVYIFTCILGSREKGTAQVLTFERG